MGKEERKKKTVKQFEYDLCNYAATFSFFRFFLFIFFPFKYKSFTQMKNADISDDFFFFLPCFAGEKGFFNGVIREHNGLFKKMRKREKGDVFFLKI